MGKPGYFASILAVLPLLAACAGYAPTPYWTIKESAILNLKPGVTTIAEVRSQIGVPLSEESFARRQEQVLEYRYLEGTTIVMLAFLHFDSKGVYKYSFRMLDPAFHGGIDR